MARKQKWYVVWVGTEPGICETWEECKLRVIGYPGSRYKAFDNREDAILAYRSGADGGDDRALIRAIAHRPSTPTNVNYANIPEIYPGSICTDGACAGNPGKMEFRCVDIFTGAEIFRRGPFEDGTNNVAEFLALVLALIYLNNRNMTRTAIYSDSRNAIKWVKEKKCNTKLARTDRNQVIFDMIQKSEQWLQTHEFTNFIIKWKTEEWGEIPADFGRK